MSTPSDKTLRLERTKLNQQPPRGRNTTLGIALVAGIAASLLIYLYLSKPAQTTAGPTAPPAPVFVTEVVASKDIPARAIIDSSMVNMKSVNPSELAVNSVPVTQSVLGKMALNPIASGAAVTSDSIADKKPYGLSGFITPGLRALTISLDPISSVAGFVKPGDHVDVLGTFDANNQSLTRTILQNVLLIATGSQAIAATAPDNGGAVGGGGGAPAVSPDGPTPKAQEVPNATVMVSPVDSQKLVIAASKGKLTLVLRASGDEVTNSIPTTHSSSVTTILPISVAVPHAAPAPAPAPPVPPMNQLPVPVANPLVPITVIRGSDAKSISVSP